MSSLALYRELVPGHSAVDDDLVTTMLALAARRHTATAWGDLYPEAMVWFAAHRVERLPGSGASGGSAAEVGTITSQSDGDLSRSYAAPVSTGSALDDELSSTRYGQFYLDLRRTRAASGPTFVGVGW